MNMFRNIFMMALIGFGLGLWFGQPESWKWPDLCGIYVVEFVDYATQGRPWTIIICMALALSIFMTKLRY